ncbi:MAG: PIN domain-containing protein [Candidatus Aenigmarchaeota archaeon]|nr:PIN domain-containing protein [Candidatus Aenigmarchaeota archaeon]
MIYFVDANIFLEVQLGGERSEECKKFLERIYKNKFDAITSDFIIYICLIQIQNKSGSSEKMGKFMDFLTNLEALEILRPSTSIISKALRFMENYKLDFNDALVVASMVENNIDKLVSFDTDFDKVEEIERIEPKDVI